MAGRISRETGIGIVVTALAIVAMAFDHLLRGADDVAAFAISAGLSLAVAVVLFGFVIPRIKAHAATAEHAAKRGFVLSLLSVLSIVLIWLGVPWVVAGGGIALGLLGRSGGRNRLATAAIMIGAAVLLLTAASSDWT